MNVALLLTGNELMTGDTVDSNSAMIAHKLAPQGFQIAMKVTIGDDVEQFVDALDRLSRAYPIVLVNGGLGPTVDDLTAMAVAKLVDQPLRENAKALDHLQRWCDERKMTLNLANLKQAMLPNDAQVIPNRQGSAVGFYVTYNDCLIACTPGVPSELTVMLDEQIIHSFAVSFPNAKAKLIRRLKVFGIGESRLQQLITDKIVDWPSHVELGFRAGLPMLELKLAITDESALADRDACENQIRKLIGEHIVGENDENLAEVVVAALVLAEKKITVAESCTGGRIAAEITSISGASRVFDLGIVAYSDAIKHRVLDVSKAVLGEHGAVSEQAVKAMAIAAIDRSSADYAIAVSGIAGPDGGTDEKPVGTVWLAWGNKKNMLVAKFYLPTRRDTFQTLVAAIGLDLIRRYLLGEYQVPSYFGNR